jgi:microcystin-dependent protein
MAIVLDGTTGINTPSINAGNIVGGICFFGMTTAPAGFLKANGAAVSRTTYADLFAAIGTTYGAGDGSTTFALPDLRNRMAIGSGDLYALGAVGGSKDAAVISHTHTGTTVSNGSHNHGYTGVNGTGYPDGAADSIAAGSTLSYPRRSQLLDAGSHSHTFTTDSTGSSGTDANLPPYSALLACIKY